MPLEHPADLPELLYLFLWEKAPERQRTVKRGRAVPLREDKPVPSLPPGTGWIHVQLRKIEIRQRIRHRQGTAGMPAFRMKRPFDDLHADPGCGCGQPPLLGNIHPLPFLSRPRGFPAAAAIQHTDVVYHNRPENTSGRQEKVGFPRSEDSVNLPSPAFHAPPCPRPQISDKFSTGKAVDKSVTVLYNIRIVRHNEWRYNI